MKTLYQSLLLAMGAFALAGTAFAQVPSSNDTSTTEGVSEILCVSRMINSLAQHKSVFELDGQLRLGSMP